MKIAVIVLIAFACLQFPLLAIADTPLAELKAQAVAEVLKSLIKDAAGTKIVVLNLSSKDVTRLKHYFADQTVTLISDNDLDYYRDPHKSQADQEMLFLDIKIEEITPTSATILGGDKHVGLSGETDIFRLKRTEGKWIILTRRPYEVS